MDSTSSPTVDSTSSPTVDSINFRTDILPLRDQLFRLALRITLNREDAEDMVQETMIRIWKEHCEGRDPDNISAYAMTTCRNLSIDMIRRKERRNVSLDETLHDEADNAPQADDRLMFMEQHAGIQQFVNTLPEKQRTIIHLRDTEGKSYKEIAEIMLISESDVKVNIFRIRQNLKALLNKQQNR